MENNDDVNSLQLKLRNGAEHPARVAYVRWLLLGGVARNHPNEMSVLRQLAGPSPESVPESGVEYLRKQYPNWFTEDGSLNSTVQDEIRSSFRETPEGEVLVSPFQLENDQQRRAFEAVQEVVQKTMQETLPNLGAQRDGFSR